MTVRQDTLWDKFLKPIFRHLINEEQILKLYQSRNWRQEGDRFVQPDISYPDYYTSQNFHGIQGGYLNTDAALTYDPITQYFVPPNETWVRQAVIDAIKGNPRTILDLGCGTGSTTLMLKKAFPQAEVIGVDLSPYMLAMADYKARQAGLEIQWRQGNAEKTTFAANAFDVVTASLLFHETPPDVSQNILRECFRLLIAGGQVIILDGNQKALRQTEWLTDIFEEPYMKAYAKESTDAWMGAANFVNVQTEDLWLIHQITKGMKPLPVTDTIELEDEEILYPNFGAIPA